MKILVWILLLMVSIPAVVMAGPVGLGISGGILAPVAQEDQANGSVFGVKIRARLSGLFTLEPNLSFGNFGGVEVEGVGNRDGSSLKHYGIDLTLGGGIAKTGLKPYLFVGGGVYNTKRDGDVTTNKSGWSFGTGLALGIRSDFDIDIRGRFNITGAENSTSRKSVGVTLGFTYYVSQN